jgi:hypothetical protein
MMKLNADQAAFAVLAGVEVPQVLSAFEPSPFTMATFAHDPEKVKWIRHGYWTGGGLALAFAAAMSMFSKTKAPLVIAVVVLAFTLLIYEWALRQGATKGTDMKAGTTSTNGRVVPGQFSSQAVS